MTQVGRVRWVAVWFWLLILGVVVITGSLLMPHVDGDVLFFGEIAKGILRSGDWVTLHNRLSPSWVVDKPPLTFWLMAGVFRVIGPTSAALRIWQIPLSIALLVTTYHLSRLSAPEAEGREEGMLAALLLGTSLLGFYHAVSPQQDVALTLFLTLGFVAYLRYRAAGRTSAALLTGVCVAAAVLSKGILALGVFGLVIAADLTIPPRRTGHWRWSQVAVGAAACATVGAPWFVVELFRLGRPFVDAFFISDASGIGIGRFFRPALRAPLPYWQALLAYVPMLIFWVFPWMALLPRAARDAWRSIGAGPPALRLCALWAGVYFLLLSLSSGDKVFRYLFLLFPPLCVLLARTLVRMVEDVRGLRGVAAITVGVAILMFTLAPRFLSFHFPEVRSPYAPMLVPFVSLVGVSTLLFAVLAWRGNGRVAVACLCAGMLVAYGALEWAVTVRWEQLWPWRTVAATINRLYRPGDRVVMRARYGPEANALVYWLDPPVQVVTDDLAIERLWHEGRVFGVFSPESYAGLRARLHPTVLIDMPMGWVLVTNDAP